MSNYSLEDLNITPAEFLRPFFDPNEKVCFRVFSDKPDSAFSGQKLECELSRFDEIEKTLKAHNDQGRGVYFVVNFGGHDDASIVRINAQFAEMDDIPLEEQLAKIQAFPLEPSMIVKTRKSLHCYWLVKNAKVEDFRRIQRKLVAQFGADPACVNESRVFRLPGFYHCKEEPVLVQLVKFNPELRFEQKDLEAVLPDIPDIEDEESYRSDGDVVGGFSSAHLSMSPKNHGTQKGLALVGRRCLFIQYCKKNAKTLPEVDWYAMISNLAVFEGGTAAIHKLSKPYPNYNERKTQAKIEHFFKSGTKPIKCATIAEKGFGCPKLTDGSCGCKAPAAFAFIPATMDELKKALAAIKPKHDAAEDIQQAQRFIDECLYNADPAFAEVFINHNVKAHFALSAGDVKALPAFQKDIFKTYMASREARRERGGDKPEWYEEGERGGVRFLPGVLAEHMAANVNAFFAAEQYYFYENGVYKPKSDLQAQALTRTFMISRYTLSAHISDAENQWKMLIIKPIREINVNSYLLNLRNGMYNVLDDAFIPHDPKYYTTVQLGGSYDPTAQCPMFLQFLSEVLPENEIPVVQEMMGYFTIPINKAQKSFVLVGAPKAGKSTILSIVQDVLLGSENVSNISWQNLSERFKSAELFGKLANIFADLPSKNIEDGDMFKVLTGDDAISAERKNKDAFSFKPYARLLFSCNEVPRNIGDRSEAFYRRLLIIRFTKSVSEEKRDPDLKERLAMERNGILMWALTGLKRLIANNYQFSETEQTRAEIYRYKLENNNVMSFLEECCVVAEGAECFREELFSAYKTYCSKNGLKAMSQISFNKEVENLYPSVSRGLDKVTRRKIYIGLGMPG